MSVCAERDTKGSRKTKIGQLQVTLPVNEQVLGLQIPVQDAVAVTVADTLNQLCHELFYHSVAQTQVCHHRPIRESLATATLADRQSLHVFLEIEVEEFHDKVEFVAVDMDKVQQLDNVGILHLLEKRDLADGGTGNALILGLETNLLQGHNSIGVVEFTGLVDHTVGP